MGHCLGAAKCKLVEKKQNISEKASELVTRHKPQSLKSSDYELWLQELSPSKELLDKYKAGDLSWEEFEEIFKAELAVSKPAQAKLKELKELAKTKEVALFCYKKKETTCHRKILKELLQ